MTLLSGKKPGEDARPEAKIITDGKVYKIVPMDGGQVIVNGQMVGSHHLSPGDLIEVAAGQMSFYCRRSQEGPSKVEEDMVLPKTSMGGIVYKEEVQGVSDDDGILPRTTSHTHPSGSSDNDDNDSDDGSDDSGLMQFGELEVAGRKIEKSSR